VLYTAVFRSYVDGLIRRGYAMEFFPEGGRSRTGRLLPPKTGMLAMVADRLCVSACARSALVPVFIGYDKVMEVTVLQGTERRRQVRRSRRKAAQGDQVLTSPTARSTSLRRTDHPEDGRRRRPPGWREQLPPEGEERPEGFTAWVRQLAWEHMRASCRRGWPGPVA